MAVLKRKITACTLSIGLLISSCGPAPVIIPTITPSLVPPIEHTQSPTPTFTQIPTITLAPLPTLEPTAIPFRTPVPLPPTTEPFGIVGQIVGVFIGSGASHNTIGSTTEGERNVISGNVSTEVSIFERANGNRIVGNYISTNPSGRARLGNAVMGISIELGGFNNMIQSNVIGNSVTIADWGSWGNSIIGNFIGVDATGSTTTGCPGG